MNFLPVRLWDGVARTFHRLVPPLSPSQSNGAGVYRRQRHFGVAGATSIHFGPDMRRGAANLNGEGDAVGGIVVMRYGENALKVIER
jgi:hypothetical protein